MWAAARIGRAEARILLCHVLQCTPTALLAHDDAPLHPGHARQYVQRVDERMRGTPIAYLLGHREFRGLDFRVTPDVLIPRPDTETLIERALDCAVLWLQDAPTDRPLRIIDLGTGSGIIAISLIHALLQRWPQRHFEVTMTDRSAAALQVARQNAMGLLPALRPLDIVAPPAGGAPTPQRVPTPTVSTPTVSTPTAPTTATGTASPTFSLTTAAAASALPVRRAEPRATTAAHDVRPTLQLSGWQGDWWQALPGDQPFDLVLSNPPYIRDDDPHLERGDLRHEPAIALTPGPNGLEALTRLVEGLATHLRPGGWVLLEHGHDQGADCRQLLHRSSAGLLQIVTRTDWGDTDRVTLAHRP